MENFEQQPAPKIQSHVAWILSGVIIFGALNTIFRVVFDSVEFVLLYLKVGSTGLTVWYGCTVPLTLTSLILIIWGLHQKLKKGTSMPKVLTIVMAILWAGLIFIGQYLLTLSLTYKAGIVGNVEYMNLMKVQMVVARINHFIYIITVTASFLIFMNRKQQGQQ